MKDPHEISSGSNIKVKWICDCGQETLAKVVNVTTGNTKSCGKCMNRAQAWYSKNKDDLLKLKTPICLNDFPKGLIYPMEDIISTGIPFKTQCYVCGSEYTPRFGDIKKGVSLTCGCTTFRTSSAQRGIADFVESLGLSVQMEHEVNKLKYDIFIPTKNVVIEYNGLRWHQDGNRDFIKYTNALKHDLKYVMVFEDEWLKANDRVKNLLQYRLGAKSPKSIRPKKCEIRSITHQKADEFYSLYHYIGPCNARINYGVLLEDKLVSCISFKRPTRQSKFEWELVRMVSHQDFRVHGIWTKLLGKFILEYKPESIVSFSDNRLFSGSTYQTIGFVNDGTVKPDYYWCKGTHRFHKSGLRKPKGEKRTESELRESDGYRKIWDVGKTRWVWRA
jgi:hypothetical protein